MKRTCTLLAIVLSWTPIFALDEWDDPEWMAGFNRTANWRMAAEEADAKSEIDKINDLATLEKISQTSNIPLLQRFALEKLNEMKKTSVMTNEVAHPIQEPPPEPNGKPSTNKTFLWVSLVALLAIIGGAAMWQRKK